VKAKKVRSNMDGHECAINRDLSVRCLLRMLQRE
jgi:hypothetical protein